MNALGSPYRTPAARPCDGPSKASHGGMILAVIVLALATLRIVGAIVRSEPIGADTGIAAVALFFAIRALAAARPLARSGLENHRS